MFKGTEEPNCILSGFKISHNEATGGIMGIDLTHYPETSPRTKATISNCIIQKIRRFESIYCCDGLIKNCIIVDNINISMMPLVPTISNCHGTIIGCTIANNYCDFAVDVGPDLGHLIIENSIIYGNEWREPQISLPEGCEATISFCNIENGTEGIYGTGEVFWGLGNIDVEPYFLSEGFWDANEGDYHLKSQVGRWDPNTQSWVIDSNTSPCIDAGDWATPGGNEPFPNGGRVNMGAYGGTIEASKSYFGTEPCETIVAGDINGDCKVDFTDLAIMALHWQENN